MRYVRLASLPLATAAVLAALSSGPRALGQEVPPDEPRPAAPEPPPEGAETEPAAPVPPPEARRFVPPVETTDEWFRFSDDLAAEFLAEDRVPDAIEEYLACATLHRRDLDVVANAAVIAIEYASSVAHGLDENSAHLRVADRLVRLGVARPKGIGDGRLAYVIGRLEINRGNSAVAYEMFQEAFSRGFDLDRLRPWFFSAAVQQSPALLAAGKAEDVIRNLESLTAELPDHPDIVPAKALLAAAYREVGDTAASDALLESLTKDYPDDFRSWAAVGRACLDNGRDEQALEAFRKSLALAASDRQAYAGALLSMAVALQHLGRAGEAEQTARGYLELEPDSAAGLRVLASILRDRGELGETLRLLRRADRISRGDPAVLELLEAVLREQGDQKEADLVHARIEAAAKGAQPPDGAGSPEQD